MLQPRMLLPRSRALPLSQSPRFPCQLQWSYRRASAQPQTPKPATHSPSPPVADDDEPRPKPLSRPLGQAKAPNPGENSGIDHRTWREWRADLFNQDKVLERRKKLTKDYVKPYFREWTSMNYHRGKTFLSPPRLFKADLALHFPNMVGYTLAAPSGSVSTTSELMGKTSIVSVFSGVWAEQQTLTFVGEKENPGLAAEVERLEGQGLQRVWINVEEEWVKAGLIRLYLNYMKKMKRTADWGKSFVVRRGLTDDIRDSIGMANGKVGYVYLVDRYCKIRWAGSGDANVEEREGLTAVVRRLVEGSKKPEGEKKPEEKMTAAKIKR